MEISGKRSQIDSPCIGICSTAIGDSVCVGCGRTFQEVIDWNAYSDEKKIEINLRLYEQRNAQGESV